MLTKRLLMPFVVMAILSAAAATVSAKGWDKIGTVTVDDKVDHSTIFMTPEYNQVYNMIKLTVAKAQIRILRIRVTFASGQTTEYTLSDLIQDGGSTADLTLPHPGHIPRLDFWYEKASLEGKKPRVSFWGFAAQ